MKPQLDRSADQRERIERCRARRTRLACQAAQNSRTDSGLGHSQSFAKIKMKLVK